ncbi:Ribonuclease H domain [Macleaya cordata]|uniref:Ribonuclease H domain n=1 Tax=Macleaya cordata TaxID=56857 RepID=A0A200PNI2_MACCD|nr:Ribonuclease H domain [Macleaya cordata]
MGLGSSLKVCFFLLGHLITSFSPLNFLWPYAKLIITCWLVIRYVGGVAYVYECIVIPCCTVNPLKLRVWFILWKEDSILSKPDNFLAMAAKYIEENGSEALEELIGKGSLRVLNLECPDTGLPQLPSPDTGISPEKAQKEWSCPLCFVSTSSEASLKEHLEGKRHKSKKKKFKASEMASGNQGIFDLTNGVNMVDDFSNTFNHHLGPTSKIGQWRTWKKPSLGWTKLNTDGSVDPKNAGLGGLLRDHIGKPICGFVSKVPQEGSFYVELWAIWRGLILALGQGHKAIWVESDSLSAVNVINRKQHCPYKAESCLKHIWDLLEKFEHYRISYAWRQVNRAADYLAKMNLDGSDIVLWPTDFPSSLCKIIEEDAKGMKYYRV